MRSRNRGKQKLPRRRYGGRRAVEHRHDDPVEVRSFPTRSHRGAAASVITLIRTVGAGSRQRRYSPTPRTSWRPLAQQPAHHGSRKPAGTSLSRSHGSRPRPRGRERRSCQPSRSSPCRHTCRTVRSAIPYERRRNGRRSWVSSQSSAAARAVAAQDARVGVLSPRAWRPGRRSARPSPHQRRSAEANGWSRTPVNQARRDGRAEPRTAGADRCPRTVWGDVRPCSCYLRRPAAVGDNARSCQVAAAVFAR